MEETKNKETKVSNCCGALIIDDSDMCYKCGEHCEAVSYE